MYQAQFQCQATCFQNEKTKKSKNKSIYHKTRNKNKNDTKPLIMEDDLGAQIIFFEAG